MWRSTLSRLASSRVVQAAAVSASGLAFAAAASSASSVSDCSSSKPDGLRRLRSPTDSSSFSLAEHYHGKKSVRVLRVRRAPGKHDTVQEYTVATRLFSPMYSKVYTQEDNKGLVATDTQKNTVYVVAQKSSATTPEGFGLDLAKHLLSEYQMLTAVEVDVSEDLWQRATVDGEAHEHGFLRTAPEKATASIRITREYPDDPEVTSGVSGLVVLKTTQSGFTDYLKDKYTLLPDTTERCLATSMNLEWHYSRGYTKTDIDYAAVRDELRTQMLKAFYGPATGGVYSASLQATIYDAGCLVLKALPAVKDISIFTPNIHMIPFHPLEKLGDGFKDDVYVATSEPAGTIHCMVSR